MKKGNALAWIVSVGGISLELLICFADEIFNLPEIIIHIPLERWFR